MIVVRGQKFPFRTYIQQPKIPTLRLMSSKIFSIKITRSFPESAPFLSLFLNGNI